MYHCKPNHNLNSTHTGFQGKDLINYFQKFKLWDRMASKKFYLHYLKIFKLLLFEIFSRLSSISQKGFHLLEVILQLQIEEY